MVFLSINNILLLLFYFFYIKIVHLPEINQNYLHCFQLTADMHCEHQRQDHE